MEVLAGLDAVSRIKSSYDSGIKKMTRPFESKIQFKQWIFFGLGNIFNRTTVEISCNDFNVIEKSMSYPNLVKYMPKMTYNTTPYKNP